MSCSPKTAKPLPDRNAPATKLASAIVPVERPVAIDPIKDIGIASSLDDLEPNNDIVDEDGVPGKPSLPAGSVLGSYSHVMIPSFGSRVSAPKAPCWGSSRSSSELDFSLRPSPICTANDRSDAPLRHATPGVAWAILTGRLSRRQDRSSPFVAKRRGRGSWASAASPHLPTVRDAPRRLSTPPDSLSTPSSVTNHSHAVAGLRQTRRR